MVDNDDGWHLELCKANTLVWTRSVPNCNFQMVKINARFEDIEPECVFDVLLDPDYRKEWDSHMLESFDIGNFNVNNDVGYYASEFVIPLPLPIMNSSPRNDLSCSVQARRLTITIHIVRPI